VENGVRDLLSLLKFLRAEPYCGTQWFEQAAALASKGELCGPQGLASCFAATLLRRTKGGVAVDRVPQKHLSLVSITMTPEECEREQAVLDEDAGKGPLMAILRSSQAGGGLVFPRRNGNLDVDETSSLGEISESARRPAADGGIGQNLVFRGEGDEVKARAWCLERYRSERAWINADKDAVLRGGKWQALSDLMAKIWHGGHHVRCSTQPREDVEAGLWDTPHGSYMQELETGNATKVVLVSRFGIRTFELAQLLLQKMNVRYGRIDQTVPPDRRFGIIDDFNNDPDTKVMLLGLKSGGVGINLQAAQVAILLDWWWNPASERQAMDRLHRVNSLHAHTYFFKFHVAENHGDKVLSEGQRGKVGLRQSTIDLVANDGGKRQGTPADARRWTPQASPCRDEGEP